AEERGSEAHRRLECRGHRSKGRHAQCESKQRFGSRCRSWRLQAQDQATPRPAEKKGAHRPPELGRLGRVPQLEDQRVAVGTVSKSDELTGGQSCVNRRARWVSSGWKI